MIIEKFSAIKGFILFFYAIITLLALVGCCLQGGIFYGIGVTNTLINGYLIYKIFQYWSRGNETK